MSLEGRLTSASAPQLFNVKVCMYAYRPHLVTTIFSATKWVTSMSYNRYKDVSDEQVNKCTACMRMCNLQVH